MLRQCVNLQPDGTAFTFVDYEQDPAGVAESLTWLQLYRRVLNVAQELRSHASAGDRAVILAPQGVDYIVAFLGAMQAGLIAVPLLVPLGGASDERVDSVLRDAAPTIILTTSSVIGSVVQRVTLQPGESVPSIIEVDLLNLNSPIQSHAGDDSYPATAYLQYTSGSTRQPAGVMMSHRNLLANFTQLMSGYFADRGGVAPTDLTVVSWLPLYHDMGLFLGVCAPILGGFRTVLTSPMAFLQRPARWMQLMASNSQVFSAAPNFAYELAARKISDDDMAGLDLGGVHSIISGSERIHAATLRRFVDRFARSNLHAKALRPSYGLAEATVYVATSSAGAPPKIVHFESDKLSAGHAERCPGTKGTPLVSYSLRPPPAVRIVDPETRPSVQMERSVRSGCAATTSPTAIGTGPTETQRTFGGRLVAASAGTSEERWLRTGDLGFISEGELFIIGRIKDLLIVYGRNHSPDDIEATIQEITRGRCVAIAVPNDDIEQLVAIIELKMWAATDEDAIGQLGVVKREVTSAISNSHGLSVADLVLVSPGSIPITTSGKVRRAECVQRYRDDEFARLDA